jgi:hypothetical protein
VQVGTRHRGVELVVRTLVANYFEQGRVVVGIVGPVYIDFGGGVVVVGIPSHLEGFGFGAPQLDSAGLVQVVEGCSGGLMRLQLVDSAPQLCRADYSLGVGESFGIWECPHSVVVQTEFGKWVALCIEVQWVVVQQVGILSVDIR